MTVFKATIYKIVRLLMVLLLLIIKKSPLSLAKRASILSTLLLTKLANSYF